MHENTAQCRESWQVQERFLELRSRWLTVTGEYLQDHQGQRLEYWRIEKANSVIVLPIQNNSILLPQPSYRPGIGETTFDFPGGRVAGGEHPEQAAIVTLQRELGIEPTSITQLLPLNPLGWAVNSSFSNQRLYGFVAVLESIDLSPDFLAATYPVTSTGVTHLLQSLNCLQCRAVLLTWWFELKNNID